MKLPFSKLQHDSLQLIVWTSRFFYLSGCVCILCGIGKEIYGVALWLLSPINFSNDFTVNFHYTLDLTNVNWQLIFLGIILTLVSCWLVLKLSLIKENE